LVSTGSGVLRGGGGYAGGASLGGVGDVRWDEELCRPMSGTPKVGREVGHLGWAPDGTPDTGWANLARTSRMRRWTSWAADVADGALTAGRANLARTSQMRRSTSILMRRPSASGVLDDTLTTGRVRGGAEGAGLTLTGAVGEVGGGAGIRRAIRGLRDEVRGSETRRGASKRSKGLRDEAGGFGARQWAPRQCRGVRGEAGGISTRPGASIQSKGVRVEARGFESRQRASKQGQGLRIEGGRLKTEARGPDSK